MIVSGNLVIYTHHQKIYFVMKVEFVFKSRLCQILSMFPNQDKNMKSDNVVKCKNATCFKMESSFL